MTIHKKMKANSMDKESKQVRRPIPVGPTTDSEKKYMTPHQLELLEHPLSLEEMTAQIRRIHQLE